MRKILLSLAVGRHVELLELARPTFEAYAARHGYDLRLGDRVDVSRPPSWSKLLLLRDALDAGYELAVWIDADALIADPSEDIADQLGPADVWALVRHQTSDGDVPNTGVWVWRNTSEARATLDQLWAQTDLVWDSWWEQSAFMRLLGWSRSRPVALRQPTALYERVRWLDLSWNCLMTRLEVPHLRIAHFSGLPHRQRLEGMRAMRAVRG